jgi:hypothetical protein
MGTARDCCIAGFQTGLCPSWVISHRRGRRRTPVHVRFAPKADNHLGFIPAASFLRMPPSRPPREEVTPLQCSRSHVSDIEGILALATIGPIEDEPPARQLHKGHGREIPGIEIAFLSFVFGRTHVVDDGSNERPAEFIEVRPIASCLANGAKRKPCLRNSARVRRLRATAMI